MYGIVSDGVTWVFLRLDNNGRKYSRSSNVIVVSYTAAPGDHTKTRVEGADVVFKYLYKIVAEQVNLLNEEEKQPGAKRQRLELDPDNAVVALTTEMEPFDSELL